MKVFLYTGSFTHTLYREQTHALPDGVELVGSSSDLHSDGIKSDIARSANRTYRAIRFVKRTMLEAIVRAGVPNVRYVRPDGCELIHSAQYPVLNRTPWVIDFEDASVFAWYDPRNFAHPRVRHTLERLFKRAECRWILPWTEAARDSLLNGLDCSGFADKIRVVYPAIRPSRRNGRHDGGEFHLLFVGSAFYYKGGMETILAYERLRRRLPIRLTMISFVPDEVKSRFRDVPGLTFRSKVSPAELESLYGSSDLLVAPFHTDTFGFVILEAFARGIPCVATDQFAIPEIVAHGRTGLIVHTETSRFDPDRRPRFSMLHNEMAAMLPDLAHPPDDYVDALADAIESLARDRAALDAMRKAAYAEVSGGRFSLAARRRALEPVYAR